MSLRTRDRQPLILEHEWLQSRARESVKTMSGPAETLIQLWCVPPREAVAQTCAELAATALLGASLSMGLWWTTP